MKLSTHQIEVLKKAKSYEDQRVRYNVSSPGIKHIHPLVRKGLILTGANNDGYYLMLTNLAKEILKTL